MGSIGKQPDRFEVQARLIRMIMGMSDPEREKLLNKLEQSKRQEMRKYPRKPSFIPVDCTSYSACFTDFIQDISSGGAFIQADGHFYLGQQITLTFALPKIEKEISVGGEVVRVNSRGIGVQFNEPLSVV